MWVPQLGLEKPPAPQISCPDPDRRLLVRPVCGVACCRLLLVWLCVVMVGVRCGVVCCVLVDVVGGVIGVAG